MARYEIDGSAAHIHMSIWIFYSYTWFCITQ